ncbi:MAG: type II toxin-antitoxin system prevent-host-death family antitoxin [Acetobacteraceae bacterium]
MSLVIDASITMAWYFADESTAATDALLDRVEAGEDILITRRGKVVARLTSPGVAVDRERARGAVSRIRARRHGVLLGDLELKSLVAEGRR